MLTSVGKTFSFEAAHHLPNYKGKCRNVHGHSYKLEVEVKGPVNQDHDASIEGMVMDFDVLTAIVNQEVITKMDHRDLNQCLMEIPTAENLAQHIFWVVGKRVHDHTAGECYLSSIKLWETEKCYAHVTGGPNELYS